MSSVFSYLIYEEGISSLVFDVRVRDYAIYSPVSQVLM